QGAGSRLDLPRSRQPQGRGDDGTHRLIARSIAQISADTPCGIQSAIELYTPRRSPCSLTRGVDGRTRDSMASSGLPHGVDETGRAARERLVGGPETGET